jgi:hypothetical protein
MPALGLHAAWPYVAAAYVVFLVLVAAYVAIVASKITRLERRLDGRDAGHGVAGRP